MIEVGPCVSRSITALSLGTRLTYAQLQVSNTTKEAMPSGLDTFTIFDKNILD
jgi:hypothetical protein